ncbi:MAG: malate synthase A [Candidatus Obscuribacterales bacterium]|nr:malate synthase A [Candidatus Obscuribacterales bacterium]
MTTMVDRIKIVGTMPKEFGEILNPPALEFLCELHNRFNPRRLELLQLREKRQQELNEGKLPDFLPETADIRDRSWEVASCPADLQDRRVEITGPVDRKMIINALNCGANVFMADFEDATSPTWTNLVEGQINLREAVRRTLSLSTPEGKTYKLNDKVATLKVRPRGWHLDEKHVLVDGAPMSGSLFDFGLYFLHNAQELIDRGSGPYFYIPKLESHLEARLWNDVFNYAQDYLKISRGTIRATMLIETIMAAFEMEEILYELRDHAAALNAGRWDYLFSMIKKMRNSKDFMLPDRAQVTMAVPFMRAYCDLLVKTCHRRKAHAMGGMAAFIPSRKDAELNKVAMAKVTEDKKREASQGFDGTWVAHPDLVSVAKAEFDKALGDQPNQKSKMREDAHITRDQLLNATIDGATVSEAGLISNISVALQYIDSWLRGIGAAGIYNLMEDAATAEISRAQLWLWVHRGATLVDGTKVTAELYKQKKEAELNRLVAIAPGRLKEAGDLLDQLVLQESFVDFLTLPAYDLLLASEK